MSTRTITTLALLGAGISMVLAANLGAADKQISQVRYCADVVTWEVEALQGIPPEHRTGTPDYKGIAAEHCPGMRPAP